MIYLYYGTDRAVCRARMRAAIESLQKKAPDAVVVRITDEAEGLDLSLHIGEQGLFYSKQIFVFDGALNNPDIAESFAKNLKEIATSEHVVFVLEKELPKAFAKKLIAAAAKTEEHHEARVSTKERDTGFAISDALLARDRKTLWCAVNREILGGAEPEAVHGTLLWGAKSLVLAHGAASAKDAGMHPYPFGKAQRAAQRWSAYDVTELYSTLVELPFRARRRGVPLGFALEHFVLSI